MSRRNSRVANDGGRNDRRRSSIGVMVNHFAGNQSQTSGNVPRPQYSEYMKRIDKKLQQFKKDFKLLQKKEALELVEKYFVLTDLGDHGDWREYSLETCKVFARDIVEEHFEQAERTKQATMRQRCTITGAVEVADELTDVLMTIQYFTGAVTTLWAGWVMVGFMIANRGVQFIWALWNHDSPRRCLEAILGVRAITDTYYMVTKGPNACIAGSTAPMIMVQAERIGTSLALESLPQMILQLSMFFTSMKAKETLNQNIFLSQMASVMASCGAMGMSCATSAFDNAHGQKLKGIHTSISGWVPPDDKPVRQTIVYVSMVVYYSLHMLLVGFGVSCLFSLSSWVVSLGVLGGHFIAYTLIRLLINKGDLRPWLKSAQGNTVLFHVMFAIISSAIPLATMRYHNLLGPSASFFCWISSILISTISIVTLNDNPYIIYTYLGILAVYIMVICIFFYCIEPGSRMSFIWTWKNWKDVLRDEIWDQRWHSSDAWGISSLNGNLDAHRAYLLTYYPEFHLPWERIKSWLIEKTVDFQDNPPLWLSHKWLKLIPSKIRNEIWEVDDFKYLQDAITEADENGDTEARKKAASIIFID
eukprot:g1052.t1